MPKVGAHDIFEQTYRNQLKALLAPHGQLIAYDEDRAALDLGLHLYVRPTTVDSLLGHVRVWFQLKGIRATTMAAEDLQVAETVSVRGLKVEHVRYWFAHPEPVYSAFTWKRSAASSSRMFGTWSKAEVGCRG